MDKEFPVFKIGDRVVCKGTTLGDLIGEQGTITDIKNEGKYIFVSVKFDNGDTKNGLYSWRFYIPTKLHKALL